MKSDLKFDELYNAEKAIFEFLSSYSREMRPSIDEIYRAAVAMQNNDIKGNDLKFIGSSLNRMDHLLDALRKDLERSDNTLHYEEFSLSSLIVEVVEHLKLNFRDKEGLRIEVLTSPSVRVLSDRGELKSIFFNLVEIIVSNHPSGKNQLIKINVEADNNAPRILIHTNRSPEVKGKDNPGEMPSLERSVESNELSVFDAFSDRLQGITGKFWMESSAANCIVYSISFPELNLR